MPQSEPVPVVDWADVQGEIFQPYSHDFSAHLLIGFVSLASGQSFLTALRPTLSRADQWNDQARSCRNLGLTFTGLSALSLPAAELASFPYVFRLGMAARGPILGDTGASAPAGWEPPYGDPAVHAWVLVTGETAAIRDSEVANVSALAAAAGVTVLHCEQAANFAGSGNRTKEHFGFDDGIGQPAVSGAPGPSFPGQGTPDPDGGWKDLALGAFLLGYPSELGEAAPYPATAELRLNGTFMAYRKLEQNVPLFRGYIDASKHLLGGDGELLAAKMMGRWRSGAPLELSPDHDDPALGADDQRNNDFRYAGDEAGLRVPRLAHIRRANPRDGLGPDNAVQPRLHRIIRRKMTYGPYLPENAADDGARRGLIFRAYNADLVSQFEMVQAQWMASANDGGGLSTDQDVVAGLTDQTDKGPNTLGSTFAIPCADGIKTLYGLPRFVTLKGGEYFFLPGLKALDWIIAHCGTTGDTA